MMIIFIFDLIISYGENQEVIYCPEDDKYRVYYEVCDKLCIERYYKNHLKSGTHK